jgi:hypothetical protein
MEYKIFQAPIDIRIKVGLSYIILKSYEDSTDLTEDRVFEIICEHITQIVIHPHESIFKVALYHKNVMANYSYVEYYIICDKLQFTKCLCYVNNYVTSDKNSISAILKILCDKR